MTERTYNPKDPLPETLEGVDEELEYYLRQRALNLDGSIQREQFDARIAQLEHRRRRYNPQTRFDQLLSVIKNNRVLAAILIGGVALIAISSAVKSADDLKKQFSNWLGIAQTATTPDSIDTSPKPQSPESKNATPPATPLEQEAATSPPPPANVKPKYSIRLQAPLGVRKRPPCSPGPSACLLFAATYDDDYQSLDVTVKIKPKNEQTILFKHVGRIGDRYAFDVDPGTYDIEAEGPQFKETYTLQITVESGEGLPVLFNIKDAAARSD